MNPLEHALEEGSGVNGKEQSTSSICQACGGFLYKCKLYGHIPLKEYMNKTFSCGCRMTENGPDTFCKEHTPIREAREDTCTLCRAYYPPGGQQTGPWFSAWGPGYQICKGCVQAGRDERRRREGLWPPTSPTQPLGG